jgi:hypothetical protein
MTKGEAVEKFVERDFNSVPQEWVKIVAESESEYPTLPMWGTMWIVDNWMGEKLLAGSREMVYSKEDIDLDAIEDEDERAALEKRIADDSDYMEDYVDEEMAGERSVLDKDGDPTSMFIYEIADEYVVGINGAGWNFYDGVWDRIYDTMGLQWHEEAKS